jgi:hypothetical protein
MAKVDWMARATSSFSSPAVKMGRPGWRRRRIPPRMRSVVLRGAQRRED